jgi:hypothetical protein
MNYPKPSWRPIRAEAPDWFVERMAHYTDRRKGFLVYAHGTAVFGDNAFGPEVVTCNAALLNVVTHSPDFSVMPMRDGNFLVSFRGPVFGLVEGEFVKQNQQQLLVDAMKRGLFPKEALIPPSADVVKAGHHVIGLYARANLYLDAESRIITGRFTPGPTH